MYKNSGFIYIRLDIPAGIPIHMIIIGFLKIIILHDAILFFQTFFLLKATNVCFKIVRTALHNVTKILMHNKCITLRSVGLLISQTFQNSEDACKFDNLIFNSVISRALNYILVFIVLQAEIFWQVFTQLSVISSYSHSFSLGISKF